MPKYLVSKVVTAILGLQYFGTGEQSIVNRENIAQQHDILYVWGANTHYFHPQNNLMIGFATSKTWARGGIFIPSLIEPYEEDDLPKSSLPPALDLLDWQDPVAEALQCVNLLFDGVVVNRGYGVYSYSLLVHGRDSVATFSQSGVARDPSLEKLWNSLLLAVYHMTDQYNDPKIQQFVNQKARLL